MMTDKLVGPSASVGLAILARAPEPGRAKTRLIPALGAETAARLQGWMLRRAVDTALQAGVGPVSLWCEGADDHPAMRECRERDGLDFRRQSPGDLGARMLEALRGAAPALEAGAMVIGTDCPVLSVDHLRAAAAALATVDAVLVPAEDGGYVLIGMRRPVAAAFRDIAWGGPEVLAQTRRQLSALGWRVAEFPTLWDVDRAEDVERLRREFPDTPVDER
jgi:hypothetical protein